MPFRSEKQRRFMFARHPDIAERWAEKYGTAIRKTEEPSRKRRLAERLARR